MDEFLKALQSIPWGKVGLCLLIAGIAIAAWVLFSKFTKNRWETLRKGGGATTVNLLFGLIRSAILLVALLLILQTCGVNVTATVAGLGIASAAAALALQDFLKDVIMGIHILSDRFFNVGDGVLFEGKEGVIQSFSLKTTKIELLEDHSVVSVCNRLFEKIERLSDQLDIDVPLSYDEDPRKIHAVLKELTKKLNDLPMMEACLYKGTQDFQESAVLYKIRCYCQPEDRPDLRRAVLKVLQEGLAEAGIKIPYKQIDVHVENV